MNSHIIKYTFIFICALFLSIYPAQNILADDTIPEIIGVVTQEWNDCQDSYKVEIFIPCFECDGTSKATVTFNMGNELRVLPLFFNAETDVFSETLTKSDPFDKISLTAQVIVSTTITRNYTYENFNWYIVPVVPGICNIFLPVVAK